jgi:hypothetical protein
VDPGLIFYLERKRGGASYLVATLTTSYSSLLVLDTGQPVMTLGGYQGWDRIVSPTDLQRAVANGTVCFFLVSSGGGGFGGNQTNVNADLVSWVTSTCGPTWRATSRAARWTCATGSACATAASPSSASRSDVRPAFQVRNEQGHCARSTPVVQQAVDKAKWAGSCSARTS